MHCARAMHVYMTDYVVITRHVGKCRSFFNTFISKKKFLISVRNESFQQITLGSGSNISQSQEPFLIF